MGDSYMLLQIVDSCEGLFFPQAPMADHRLSCVCLPAHVSVQACLVESVKAEPAPMDSKIDKNKLPP